MSHAKYKAGEIVFRQGYPADNAYVIESGQVEIFQELADGKEEHVATLGAGQMFGEYGVLDDAPRSASARAVEDTTLKILKI